MKLDKFKSAVENCVKDVVTFQDGIQAVNTLLRREGLAEVTYFPGDDAAQVLTQGGMPCGVLVAVNLLREKYGRPVAAYAA